ncbi:fatty acid desaturase [Microbacterium keratanolyticum]|uniref:Fatty acid desaturase domain-containing protein n=1 Tax=Microbacterium keratanolyticum TaxID=67574 RepID=A0A9W6HQP8_9MICO|nr:acyl-CoA desaturase [Microbacterium keratanolyticum]MBM7468348.1 fatty acid desaturase [Microbacterium keratanolyticum]GLK00421.1 hypothetical protein GCM10017596_01360 [Microbacterium keratanolyticum]
MDGIRSTAHARPRDAVSRGSSTFTELAQQVRERGLLRRRYGYYWSKLIGAPLVLASCLLVFVWIGDTWWQLLGVAFAPNHKGMPIVPRELTLDFLRRQVMMSRNIRGNRALDIAMGGLNYQIEHHLFPSMPRPHLRRAAPMIAAYCREQGVPYTQVGLFASYAIVIRYINRVGLGERDVFTCPLADQRSHIGALTT